MFTRKPANSLQKPASPIATVERASTMEGETTATFKGSVVNDSIPATEDSKAPKVNTRKRTEKSDPPSIPLKRSKSTAQATAPCDAGQKTLKGFFKPKSLVNKSPNQSPTENAQPSILPPTEQPSQSSSKAGVSPETSLIGSCEQDPNVPSISSDVSSTPTTAPAPPSSQDTDTVIDPIASKEDWSKLFSKKPPPKCESHQEPCISLTTKKPGINCGRAFWICPRPLGPSGNKEKGTQWRCATFIWASDWNSPS